MHDNILKTVFIILLFIASSCVKDKRENFISYNNIDMVTCGNSDENEELYRLNEIYFTNDQKLTFRLRIIYFTNGISSLDSTKLIATVKNINKFFLDNNARIDFELISMDFIKGAPETNPKVLPFIQDVERLRNQREPIDGIRNSYQMKHFRFWNTLFGVDDAINMYVFDDRTNLNIAGQAGGMGANFFAVKSEFCSVIYNTAAHELSHCLNLLHVQTLDKTNGFTNFTGDGICDTPAIPSLLGMIDENCTLSDHWRELIPEYEGSNEGNDYEILSKVSKEQLYVAAHNIMSYSTPFCRTSFTEQQIRRMRKSIETSQDLKSCIIGMEKYDINFLQDIN